jgi:hypothetical protein
MLHFVKLCYKESVFFFTVHFNYMSMNFYYWANSPVARTLPGHMEPPLLHYSWYMNTRRLH